MFEFVAVTGGLNPVAMEYFHNYLVSITDSVSKNWNLQTLVRSIKKILKEHKNHSNHNIFIDSGGYHVITGEIKKPRYFELIQTYHYIMEKFRNDFDYIFSLDINWPGRLTEKELFEYNKTSIENSIELLNKYEILKEKQLFVWQTRNPFVYETWSKMYEELNIKNTYRKWAFGGLVGFKRVAKVKFSPFVPSFLDFMVKRAKDNLEVKHVHFLGQSSLLAVMSAALLKHLFKIENITLDSSELVRVVSLEQKFPIFIKNRWVNTFKELEHILENVEYEYLQKTGRLHNNNTFIKIIANHVDSLFRFADSYIEEIYEDFRKLERDKFLSKWPQLSRGKFYDEFKNNIDLIHQWVPLIENCDTDASKQKYVNEILSQYKSF